MVAFHFHQHNPQGFFQMYNECMEELFHPSSAAGAAAGSHAHSQTSLLYHLAVLKEKVNQVQSFVSLVLSPDPVQAECLSMVVSGARNLIQEIVVAASSMMYALQQLAGHHGAVPPTSAKTEEIPKTHLHDHMKAAGYEASAAAQDSDEVDDLEHVLGSTEALYSNSSMSVAMASGARMMSKDGEEDTNKPGSPPSSSCEIIELEPVDLMAKYTHYCQVCGKGFKRDANLRMHMRAHGDEYKTSAALANPMKKSINNSSGGGEVMAAAKAAMVVGIRRKYSCPQEGCRWNRKHAKFQPLKSMICVKNHYKRSHCPKMYVCNRCNCKQFAVLSDLRTHEKHCGDLKWMCSCGTTFSRKDKLMGHVSLFAGHAPVPGLLN